MTAELAVLGLLVEQPMHGYGIEQLIEQRGMRNWTAVGFSSIYQLLDRLVAKGLARVEVEPAPGRGRERRVHHATDAGRRSWESTALRALADVDGAPGGFLLALSGLPLLGPAAAVDALRRRIDQLESRMADLDRDLAAARPVPPHVEAMFDFSRTRLDGEADWVRRFVDALTSHPDTEVPS